MTRFTRVNPDDHIADQFADSMNNIFAALSMPSPTCTQAPPKEKPFDISTYTTWSETAPIVGPEYDELNAIAMVFLFLIGTCFALSVTFWCFSGPIGGIFDYLFDYTHLSDFLKTAYIYLQAISSILFG